MKNVKEFNKNNYRLSIQRIATQVGSDLDHIMNLCTKISLDQRLYEMLDKEYSTNLAYVEAYYDYFKPYLYLNGKTYKQINQMVVYTNNPTILNSGLVFKIDDQVKNKKWYQNVLNSPHKLHIVYGQSVMKSDNTIYTPVSVIQILNEYEGINHYTKIIKISLNVKNIVSEISSKNIRGNIFIFNSRDELLFADSKIATSQELKSLLNDRNDYNFIQQKIDNHLNWEIINIMDIEKLKRVLKGPRNKIIFLTLMSLFLSSLILFLIYRSFYVRLNSLSRYVSNLDQDDFTKQYTGSKGKDEVGDLIKAYNKMVKKIKTLVMDVYEAKLEQSDIKLEKKQAEINALQSQMNPHFLFNTLESIRMKSIEKEELETAEIIKYLARSFRRIMSFDQEWVSVAKEVENIKDFLKIQKYRFGSEFEYCLDIEPETLKIKIPKLLIQPLVENACIHGIEGSEEYGKIFIQIKFINNKLVCIIKDNGVGINEEKLDSMLKDVKKEKTKNNNVGIANIYKRLNLYYGDNFELSIDSKEGEGTSVKLIIFMEV